MPDTERSFQSLSENLGRFNFKGKKVLIPEMTRTGMRLLASSFQSFGIDASIMETYKGLDLGLEYSSGKECYPCQVTLGDILYAMKTEKEKKGPDFNIDDYIYFLAEASGPCRFGMYNKFQRIVLDSFPEYQNLKISSFSNEEGYSMAGLVDKDKAGALRKSGFYAFLMGDILDRMLWRIRPYEKEKGMADNFMEESISRMESAIEKYTVEINFDKILDELEKILEESRSVIDRDIPRKPLIGIVGEIYLRTHVRSNQDLIRIIEKHGGEVVNASITEWVNYISYNNFIKIREQLRLNLKQFNLRNACSLLKKVIKSRVELFYQEMKQKQVYDRINPLLDIENDHKISHLEEVLEKEGLFSFKVGTEACLSIASILEYAREGFNGVVNVYPFTCMPSTTTSAIINPVMNEMGVPYLDTPYDSSVQPGREAAIRTFMYQAEEHMKLKGRKTSRRQMAEDRGQ